MNSSNENTLNIESNKYAEAQMMIRKPAEVVFGSFIDPEQTKHFWFTKGSGQLEVNKKVTWTWEMYNVSAEVEPLEIVPNEKILYKWGEPSRNVEFLFKTLKDGTTYVSVKEWGFQQEGDELMEAIKGSTGGFTTVLDGLKAYLEHGINLNLIADKFPKEVSQHGK